MKCKVMLPIIMIIILITVLQTFAGEGDIRIRFEGHQINDMPNQAAIINNVPSLSLELVADKFGMSYEYNSEERNIQGKIGDSNIRFKLGSKFVYINEERIPLESSPMRINGYIMIPIDFIRKVFKGKVTWDEEERIINIYRDNNIEVHFIDVGEGESILIDYKDYHILINSGGEEDGIIVRNYLKNQGVKDIQLYISTNYNLHEKSGLKDVMESFNIYKFLYSGDKKEADELRGNLSLMPSNNVVVFLTYKDMKMDLSNGVHLKLMKNSLDNPTIILQHTNIELLLKGTLDNRSYKDFKDTEIIKLNISSVEDLTNLEILENINPKVVIIDASYNSFIEDSEELDESTSYAVYEKLKELEVEVYDTKADGSIVLKTDGEKYELDTREFSGIVIRQLDLINHRITLQNHSKKNFDLGGCIVEDKENNVYYIEKNSIVKAGHQNIFDLIKEGQEKDVQGDFVIRDNFVTDKGTLYDTKGNVIAEIK
ncbi:stalk domain-containing protein [Alkaliphilus serpentinus]|uniref:Copper amine oxidase-like N-terminal domain-containing protein n=1 Tax=Alkaliphilus serpentinus TaxID=1482731 RepID=A0A833M758_9FIRM|nr:stalk domain-containing protein [Alkaliphilus serpentinus]KAB3529698.1 hypothetical protein F8153_08855 [Alkaliphilus serpentinus]